MRRRGLTEAQFFEVMRTIGYDRAELVKVVNAAEGIEAKQVALDEQKEVVRKTFKRKLFEVHPDRNPDDPQAEERCKVLNSVRPLFMRVLATLKVVERPKPVVRRIRIISNPTWTQTNFTNATNATTSTGVGYTWSTKYRKR